MEEYFNLIGIDPGNNLGVSIFTIKVDGNNYVIENILPRTYILDTYSSVITDDRVMNKLLYIKSIVKNLVDEFNPLVISMETAFMNSRFPKAVINLSQYVGTLELAFKENNSYIKIFKYAPKYIKSKIIKGDANKNDMKAGISKIEELKNKLELDTMSEHSIDATAIGYTSLLEIRDCPIILALTS